MCGRVPTVSFAILALTATGCGQSVTRDVAHIPASVAVSIVDGETGRPDAPLPMGKKVRLLLGIKVLGESGEVVDFNGYLSLEALPGKLSVHGAQNVVESNGVHVLVQHGSAEGIEVYLRDAYGKTRILASDLGFSMPARGRVPACEDDIDNDGDGYWDFPGDSGCLSATDDSEEAGTGIGGVSPPLYFDTPSLAEVQGKSEASPFLGKAVRVEKGFMVVTGVVRDGMYVTDLAEKDNRYNHIFVFNFNTPEGVRVCDRILWLSGSVGEFYGFTELNFPSWGLDPWYPGKGACPLPDVPPVLAGTDWNDNEFMEGMEAALVRVVDVETSSDFVDCDYDGDGEVGVRDYANNLCSDECQCREACEKDPNCLELNQYREYGQWAVHAPGSKLFVVTRENVPDFDPLALPPGTKVSAITGVLRNMRFLRPPWILIPRCPDDLVLSGEPSSAKESCLSVRTGEEYAPN